MREVKRRAEADEWVKIVKAFGNRNESYKNNEIHRVISVLCNGVLLDCGGAGAYHNEYVVLENYKEANQMNKFKAGDKVRIIADTCYHEQKIGSVVTLESMKDRRAPEENRPAWGIVGSYKYISERDVEPIQAFTGKFTLPDGRTIDLTIDLTDEQSKALRGEDKKDPFERVEAGTDYRFIDPDGSINCCEEECDEVDDARHSSANYCTDETMLKKRAAQETLSRLLWRFAMQNGGEPIVGAACWMPQFSNRCWEAGHWGVTAFPGAARFVSEHACRRAIDEIIIPYCKEHPELGL